MYLVSLPFREINMGREQQTQGAGGSRFAAAFGLLRQYMKEQPGGRGAAVTMDLMPGANCVEGAEERIKKTMELFPQQAGTLNDNSRQRIMEPERAQLTIFYGGKTIVFDDFPADKAGELMQLAASFAAPATSDDAGAELVGQNAALAQPFLSDMPVARKASLQRFLVKRKSRLAAADPYPVPLMAPARAAKETRRPAEDGGAPWLGFNSGLHLN
ncbi:hypothetical protein ACUV84_006021 [Puccinellia chinampoensis]